MSGPAPEMLSAGRRVATTIRVIRDYSDGLAWDGRPLGEREVEYDVEVSGYVYEVADSELGVSLLEADSSLSDEERERAEELLMDRWCELRKEAIALLNEMEAEERCTMCGRGPARDRYCSTECMEADQ